jgi:hypothetical protein
MCQYSTAAGRRQIYFWRPKIMGFNFFTNNVFMKTVYRIKLVLYKRFDYSTDWIKKKMRLLLRRNTTMNVKNIKSLLIIGAAILVLAAGTILLGNYADNASDNQKLCEPAASSGCCGGCPKAVCGDEPKATKLCSDSDSK